MYDSFRLFLHPFMRRPSFFLHTLLSALFVLLPLSVSAAFALPDSLQRESNVSRAVFVRTAVEALGLPVVRGSVPQGTYGRSVPRSLAPFVRSAEQKDALAILGKNVAWSLPVTRGEAAAIMAGLTESTVTSTPSRFSDVRKGSDLEQAVQAVLEQGWMRPLRKTRFGTDILLSGRDAYRLLKNASQERMTPTPTVQIEVVEPQISTGDILQTVRQLLENNYLYNDRLSIIEAPYEGPEALVNSLADPYTIFMRPSDTREFQVQLEGEVTGIGAQVEMINTVLVIVSPLSGSPAEAAGLRAGDWILGVDNISLQGLTLSEAVAKVRGPVGSLVVLTIRRDGKEFNVTVKRDFVRVPEIDIAWQDDIVVVQLVQFGQITDTNLRSLMRDVQKEQPRGIILDLRNNPGGLLHAAETVLSNFLPEGSGIANILTRANTYRDVTADPPTIDAAVPMVVLVNRGSASASEIVAGALQDAKRATVLGEQTFGKGTVQQIIEFRDGSSIKMTIAEWRTPEGRVIDGVGVIPDVIVVPSVERDEQLLRAIDLLR